MSRQGGASANGPANEQPIRVGLIGYGTAGAIIHRPMIEAVAGLRLAKVVTSRPAPGLAVDDPARVIADPAIDLVVIATPTDSHAALADAALRAGKHVVVDKPFTADLADADALIALARDAGKTLSVFHNRRWDGDFLAVRAAVDAGACGRIALFEACWDRFRPAPTTGWRDTDAPGSGILYDLGAHMIDQAVLLFGWPERIGADVAHQRGGGSVDYFSLTLHYGAMRAVLSSSLLCALPRPRFALHGDAGSLATRGLDPWEAALREERQPDSPGFIEGLAPTIVTRVDAAGIVREATADAGTCLHFYEALVDALCAGTPPPVSAADARDVIALIGCALDAAETGRVVAPPPRTAT